MDPNPNPKTTRAQALAALCRRCGLCCSGALFSSVPVTAAEAVALAGEVRSLCRDQGAVQLRQPCSARVGGGCAVYDRRPGACRAFECHLYRALAEGEVGLDEAVAVVEHAQQVLAGEGRTLAFERLVRVHFLGSRAPPRG